MKAHKAASNQLTNLREVTLLPAREVSLTIISIYVWHLSRQQLSRQLSHDSCGACLGAIDYRR